MILGWVLLVLLGGLVGSTFGKFMLVNNTYVGNECGGLPVNTVEVKFDHCYAYQASNVMANLTNCVELSACTQTSVELSEQLGCVMKKPNYEPLHSVYHELTNEGDVKQFAFKGPDCSGPSVLRVYAGNSSECIAYNALDERGCLSSRITLINIH